MPRLRDVYIKPVINAPGARGMQGKPYFHQKPLWFLNIWKDTTFAAKTITWRKREGNMPLKKDGDMPQEIMPRCIVVDFWGGNMLNCVGLSNFGAEFYFKQGYWQAWPENFIISFATISVNKGVSRISPLQQKISQAYAFIHLLKQELPKFHSKIILDWNFGCPNTGEEENQLAREIPLMLDIAAEADVPLMVNFRPTTNIGLIKLAADHKAVDAIRLAGTVKYGHYGIDWKRIFGRDKSPFEDTFGLPGGLSGPVCLPFVVRKVSQMRAIGIKQVIFAGNGIRTSSHVEELRRAGANGIAIGSIATVRPWQVHSVVKAAYNQFGQ